MKKYLFIFSLLFIGGLGFWIWNKNQFLLNPLTNKNNKNEVKKELKVFGFLPTWMIGKTRQYTNEVSHLIFLGIETDEKGNLIWDVQSKKIKNDEYLAQKNLINQNGGKNILGIKLFDDNKLKILLENKEFLANLTKQIKDLVDENKFDGVNLDFEFQKDPVAILEEEFTLFIDGLRLAGINEISVDVFANTIIKGDELKIKVLIEKIDNLVIMAYDFHRPGVDYAGPVAPIGSNVGKRNIQEILEKTIALNLDKKKIIMAYPLYGYEWETYTNDFGSQIKRGWYQMSSWKRTKELIKEKNLEVKWDELSMSPWLVFKENNKIHQIYFENEKSLKAKTDLVKQNQLGGYGFWALGYEGEENLFIVNKK
jgi:spore germination protein YaaH